MTAPAPAPLDPVPGGPAAAASEPPRARALRRRLSALAVSVAAAALLVLVVLRFFDVDRARLLTALARVSIGWLACAVCVRLGAAVVKARRWQGFIERATARAATGVLSASLLGYLVNALVPIRLGELVRIGAVCRKNEAPVPLVASTVLAERILDLLMLVALAMASTRLFPGAGWARGPGPLALAAIGAIVAAAILGNERLRRRIHPLVGRRLARLFESVVQGLAALRQSRSLALGAGMTIAAWVLELVGTALAFKSFGVAVPWQAALVLTTALALGLSIQATPAGLGTHQLICVLVLGGFGVSADRALAYSLGSTAATLAGLAVGTGASFLPRATFLRRRERA